MPLPSFTTALFENTIKQDITPQFTAENSPYALDIKCGRAALYSARQGIMIPPLPKYKCRANVRDNAINYILGTLQRAGIQITFAGNPEKIIHGHIHIGKCFKLLGIPDNKGVSYLFQLSVIKGYEINDYRSGTIGYFDNNNAQVIMRLSGLSKALVCYYAPETGEIVFNSLDLNIIYADEIIKTATAAIENGNLPPQLEGEPAECAECPFQALCYTPTTSYPTCRNCAFSGMGPNGAINCSKYNIACNPDETYKGCDKHLYRPEFLNNWSDLKSVSEKMDSAYYENLLNNENFVNGYEDDEFSSKEIHFLTDKGMLGDTNIQKIKNMFNAKVIK